MKNKFGFVLVMGMVLALTACSGESPSTKSAPPTESTTQEEHEHHHEAPHGGTLVELGDHQGSLEVLAGADGLLTLYVLDAHAENPVRIKQLTVELEAQINGSTEKVSLDALGNPLTGETPGDTSEFAATVKALEGASGFEVKIKQLDFKGIIFENILFSYKAEKE